MNGVCIHCGRSFIPNPRVKNQRYCSQKSCQKARRARWQKFKMADDPDYKENQQRCWERWLRTHPKYYRDYRRKCPEYVKRNRLLQIMRDAKRGKDKVSKLLAKMDSLRMGFYGRRGELFRVVAQDNRMLAKMDSLVVKLIPCKELGSYG